MLTLQMDGGQASGASTASPNKVGDLTKHAALSQLFQHFF